MSENFIHPWSSQNGAAPPTSELTLVQALYQALIDDEARNRRICDDVVESAIAGRSPLVLTERNEHLDRLEHRLAGRVRHLVALRAGRSRKQQQTVTGQLRSIPRDEARVILATGKHVGEGFDDSRLDTLFLTLPVSWRGTIAQYAGRLHRLYDGKREVRVTTTRI
jgi:superfamily II DNA or RNA helicase